MTLLSSLYDICHFVYFPEKQQIDLMSIPNDFIYLTKHGSAPVVDK